MSLDAARGCFKYASAKEWNGLPPSVREAVSLPSSSFRYECSQWLFANQSRDAGIFKLMPYCFIVVVMIIILFIFYYLRCVIYFYFIIILN